MRYLKISRTLVILTENCGIPLQKSALMRDVNQPQLPSSFNRQVSEMELGEDMFKVEDDYNRGNGDLVIH
jgi:hypothetical protein